MLCAFRNQVLGRCREPNTTALRRSGLLNETATDRSRSSVNAIHASSASVPELDTSTEPSLAPSLVARLAQIAEQSKGVLALCDQGVVSLTNFLTGLLIGRVAGKNELGLYAVCWTLVIIATEVSAALITTPYTVFGPQMGRTERSRYLGSMLVQQIALSLVAAALMLSGIAVASSRGASGALAHVVTTTAAVIVFISLREFVRRICFAELRVTSAVVLDIAACFAQILGLAVLWRTGWLTASAAYVLLGGLSMAVAFAWLFLNRKKLSLRRCYWIPGFQHNWTFARWVLASGLLWAAAMYVYPWFLTMFHGTAATGLWAACCAIVAMGNPILLGLGNYLGPKISNVYASDGTRQMRRYVYRSSILLTALLLPLVLVLVVFGGRIVTKMYGAAYGGNGVVVALLALNLLVAAFAFPYSRGLFTLQVARADMLVNIVAIALLFTVGIAAVKSHAAVGAAAALLLSAITTAAIRVAVFERVARGSESNHELVAFEAGCQVDMQSVLAATAPTAVPVNWR
jgi:O-antigen/teichoic acid export membrane protein